VTWNLLWLRCESAKDKSRITHRAEIDLTEVKAALGVAGSASARRTRRRRWN
jgi:hypothetical protein